LLIVCHSFKAEWVPTGLKVSRRGRFNSGFGPRIGVLKSRKGEGWILKEGCWAVEERLGSFTGRCPFC